jgi:hypothetical protein
LPVISRTIFPNFQLFLFSSSPLTMTTCISYLWVFCFISTNNFMPFP